MRPARLMHFCPGTHTGSAQKLRLGPASTTSCLLLLENLYRLINTRKGSKKHFIKRIRICFKLLNVAQETRLHSPSFKTGGPAVYGTCSCSEAHLVLTAGGKRSGTLQTDFCKCSELLDIPYPTQLCNVAIKTDTV